MMGGCFANISATDGSTTLADLKVTGYSAPVWDDDEEDYVGGCRGSFNVQFLTTNGAMAKSYFWVDNGEVTPGWYANTSGSKTIVGGATSVEIPAGKGLWIVSRGMTLTIPAPEHTK